MKGVVLLRRGCEVGKSELTAAVQAKLGSVNEPKSIDDLKQLKKRPVRQVLKTEWQKSPTGLNRVERLTDEGSVHEMELRNL